MILEVKVMSNNITRVSASFNVIKEIVLCLLLVLYPLLIPLWMLVGLFLFYIAPGYVAILICGSEDRLTPGVLLSCYVFLWIMYHFVYTAIREKYHKLADFLFELKW